jgi:AbiJ N-terminal domain 4
VAIVNLFSKRRKRTAGEVPDVYTYDIPERLRVQIIHIWTDALGRPDDYNHGITIRQTYQAIVEMLRREYGVFVLHKSNHEPRDDRLAFNELCQFFLDGQGIGTTNGTDKALDVIELSFQVVDTVTRSWEYIHRNNCDEVANDSIDELNKRFKEHGVGYSFSDGHLLRIDSEFVHAEVVKPALSVLRQKGFETPQKEFLGAHEHYRHGKKSEALVECYKAFESTMKVICAKRRWTHNPNAAAAELVKVCLDKGLIPSFWQSHFAGLRSTLESAIPTPRNKGAGHGAGTAPPHNPPDELVAYVLHMTAATILFLAEAERKLP